MSALPIEPGPAAPTVLALFPGQGSQAVGMGQRAAATSRAAAEVFDIASDVLSVDARELCWRTPLDVLTRTENAQPAITVAALASWAGAAELLGDADVVCAGHSVGAIAAAAAAGYLTVAAAITLAAARGELMSTVPGDGSMLAVAVSACDSPQEQEERARQLAARLGLDVGAINGPTQVVLSGPRPVVASASEEMRGKAKELSVSHAFHSRMMTPAETRWHAMVDAVELAPGTRTYHGCITGTRARSGEDVRADLRASLTSPVLWSRVMEATRDLGEIRVFGPGRAIARLARPYRAGRDLIVMEGAA